MHSGPREHVSQRADDGLGLRRAEGLRHEHALWHDHAVHVGVEQRGAGIGSSAINRAAARIGFMVMFLASRAERP